MKLDQLVVPGLEILSLEGTEGEKCGQPMAPSKAIKLQAVGLITCLEKNPHLKCFQTVFLQMPVRSDSH